MKQIGNTGSEGKAYLFIEDGVEYVMKKFKNKSKKNIKKEGLFQKIASIKDISPKVYKINDNNIIMEKMDKNLIEHLRETDGQLSIQLQNRIIYILDVLDNIGVFHNDPNPCNFMFKNNELYIIDFGYSKIIDKKLIKKYNTPYLNKNFMILGFILRIKELFKKNIYYEIFNKYL
tara:strand:- start:209 stop:733 length:525 start_codon:yes stop_codon:yes gene_type:complete